MLPDYLVDGYGIASSSSELLSEFGCDKLEDLCDYMGVKVSDVESTDWCRYVWNKEYVIYPKNRSEICYGSVYAVLYEELDNDDTIESVIGISDYSLDTEITVFGPSKDMNPLVMTGIDRSNSKLYRDMRYLLKFLVKMDLYSRSDVIQSVRKSLDEFSKSLDC